MIHLDTSYLVDLLREKQRGTEGPASQLLRDLGNETLAMSGCVLCELRAGAEMSIAPSSEHEAVGLLEDAIELAPLDGTVAKHYGRVLARLKADGEVIAAMDLLIASAALAADASLVTRNTRHFERVPGLSLRGY